MSDALDRLEIEVSLDLVPVFVFLTMVFYWHYKVHVRCLLITLTLRLPLHLYRVRQGYESTDLPVNHNRRLVKSEVILLWFIDFPIVTWIVVGAKLAKSAWQSDEKQALCRGHSVFPWEIVFFFQISRLGFISHIQNLSDCTHSLSMLFYCQADTSLDILSLSVLDVLKHTHGVELRILGLNFIPLIFNLFLQVQRVGGRDGSLE